MRRFFPAIFSIALLSAAPHPDFSGIWKMDPTRSESAHQDVPVGPVTLLITQTAGTVTIETRTDEGDKATIANETLTYKLDGSESLLTVEGGTTVKSKAHWEGAKLITETTRSVKDSTITTRYVYSASPNAAEMTVEKALTVQHGYMGTAGNSTGRGKDVFVKQRK